MSATTAPVFMEFLGLQSISFGPASWLWDYLRRSRTQGYFLPLSGGIDSCATATIAFSMCRLVAEAANRGGTLCPLCVKFSLNHCDVDDKVIADARRIAGEPEDSTWVPTDPRDLANRIFHTCYMGTENSSADTRKRAKELAEAIGRCAFDSRAVTRSLTFD